MTDLVSTSDWMKGITLSVIASMIGGASKLAIRKSWLLEQGNNLVQTKWSLFLRLSGMFGMTVMNPLCGVWAMNYASPSITAPFSGLTLVWIVALSEMYVGEKPRPTQIAAASIIVLGQLIVAAFGDHTNDDDVTLKELQDSYLEIPFLIYLIFMGIWMVLVTYWMFQNSNPLLQRFAWGVSGGSLTGVQNFLKDGLTILKAGEGIPMYFYLFFVLSMLMAFGGLLYLTECMKRYDVTYSASMFVGSYVVSASIMSAVHYHTFSHLEHLYNLFMYPLGIFILMIGVYVLVIESKETNDEGSLIEATDAVRSNGEIA